MFLFKASGKTYRRVALGAVHAFPHSPAEANEGELVLLSKNREDCRPSEKQIRFTARIRDIREARPTELEKLFPAVGAEVRWKSAIRLYSVCELAQPFDLNEIDGLNAKHYRTVQGFSRLGESDMAALFTFLVATNPKLIIDMLNAEEPDNTADMML